ncbi:MAG: hypothetical protein ACMUIP_17225 [bacterium]
MVLIACRTSTKIINYDAYLTWSGYDGIEGEPEFIWNGEKLGKCSTKEIIQKIRNLKTRSILLIYPKYPYIDEGPSGPERAYPFNYSKLMLIAKDKEIKIIFSEYDHKGRLLKEPTD